MSEFKNPLICYCNIVKESFDNIYYMQEEKGMSEKMLITQALDERDMLVKKTVDKINKASFVDTIKPNEEKVYEKKVSKQEFARETEAAYQQIMDLIRRYERIDAAIVASNAKTQIETSYGTFPMHSAAIRRPDSGTSFLICMQDSSVPMDLRT